MTVMHLRCHLCPQLQKEYDTALWMSLCFQERPISKIKDLSYLAAL